MVSIKGAVSELEKARQFLDTALVCYQSLISDLALYTPSFQEECNGLEGVALAVKDAEADALPQFNTEVRELLREHAARATAYVAGLQEDRLRTERVLKELAASLTQADVDNDGRIRKTVDTLRTIARTPEARGIRDMLATAAESIEQGMDRIRRQQQITIAQFHTEIRSLQRRLGTNDDSDNMTALFSRAEIQTKLSAAVGVSWLIVMTRARGLRLAAVQYHPDVAEQLASAFVVRMRNLLPVNTAIGRWGEEEFLSLIPGSGTTQGSVVCRSVAENLPGGYACAHDGRNVRAYVEVTVCSLDTSAKDAPRNTVERIVASFARI